MDFDLNQFADRLKSASERTSGIKITISATDLILSKDGYGTGRSEGIPFPALFLREEDVLGKVLDRLVGPKSLDPTP